jgi:hypothetical protein
MLDIDDELRRLSDELGLRFDEVSLRGQGRARFLFARHSGRAVEISVSEGKWWLEFWDADPEPDAAPVLELTLQSSQEAAQQAADWLNGEPGRLVRTDTKGEIPRE